MGEKMNVILLKRLLCKLGFYGARKIVNEYGQVQTLLRNGIPLVGRDSSTAGTKHKDWWKRENTPEATMEQKYQGYKSLEEKGKLKIPAGKKGGVPVGVLPDADEFKKEYADFKAGKREEQEGSKELLDFEKPI